MKNLLLVLTLLWLAMTPMICHADTMTYGPVTIGNNSPLGYMDYAPDYNVLIGHNPNIPGLFSPNGGTLESGSVSFVYDLTPGWTADLLLRSYVDVSPSTIQNEEDGNYAAAFFQEIILCPSSSPVACTNGSIAQEQYGTRSFLPIAALTPNAVAEPGTGIYEYAAYAYNATEDTDAGIGGVDIYLSQGPEPSTFILLGTGIAGFVGIRRRCGKSFNG